jgi:hypothetical protein
MHRMALSGKFWYQKLQEEGFVQSSTVTFLFYEVIGGSHAIYFLDYFFDQMLILSKADTARLSEALFGYFGLQKKCVIS